MRIIKWTISKWWMAQWRWISSIHARPQTIDSILNWFEGKIISNKTRTDGSADRRKARKNRRKKERNQQTTRLTIELETWLDFHRIRINTLKERNGGWTAWEWTLSPTSLHINWPLEQKRKEKKMGGEKKAENKKKKRQEKEEEEEEEEEEKERYFYIHIRKGGNIYKKNQERERERERDSIFPSSSFSSCFFFCFFFPLYAPPPPYFQREKEKMMVSHPERKTPRS